MAMTSGTADRDERNSMGRPTPQSIGNYDYLLNKQVYGLQGIASSAGQPDRAVRSQL